MAVTGASKAWVSTSPLTDLQALLAAHAGDDDFRADGVDDEARAFRHVQRQDGVVLVVVVLAVRPVDLDAHHALGRLEFELVLRALELGDELDFVADPRR